MKKYHIDLHTHSKLSPDGSIEEKDYQKILDMHLLDFVAITDHNTIEYAIYCQKKIGSQIIIGEEISTQQGHLIGLFLKQSIESGKDIFATASEIKSQGGLVYAPHVYDIFRHGIGEKQLNRILDLIDILEIYNGRMIFQYFNNNAKNFAIQHQLIGGFGSDAHDSNSLGKGALILSTQPTLNIYSFKNSSIEILPNSPLRFFAPKYNRFKKYFNI